MVASHLLPAHFALLETEKIAAVVSEHGGPTSHGAIFARALEIPSVTGATGILEAARPGEQAIVDGLTAVTVRVLTDTATGLDDVVDAGPDGDPEVSADAEAVGESMFECVDFSLD